LFDAATKTDVRTCLHSLRMHTLYAAGFHKAANDKVKELLQKLEAQVRGITNSLVQQFPAQKRILVENSGHQDQRGGEEPPNGNSGAMFLTKEEAEKMMRGMLEQSLPRKGRKRPSDAGAIQAKDGQGGEKGQTLKDVKQLLYDEATGLGYPALKRTKEYMEPVLSRKNLRTLSSDHGFRDKADSEKSNDTIPVEESKLNSPPKEDQEMEITYDQIGTIKRQEEKPELNRNSSKRKNSDKKKSVQFKEPVHLNSDQMEKEKFTAVNKATISKVYNSFIENEKKLKLSIQKDGTQQRGNRIPISGENDSTILSGRESHSSAFRRFYEQASTTGTHNVGGGLLLRSGNGESNVNPTPDRARKKPGGNQPK